MTGKWAAVLTGLTAVVGAGSWGFAIVFDHASFAGGILLAAALGGGMAFILLISGMDRMPGLGLALGVIVWLVVVGWGLHMARESTVEEVARFVRRNPELRERWGELSDEQIWDRFLVENGLGEERSYLGDYLRLRSAQGIEAGSGSRTRELRGLWLYAEWLHLVLLVGMGTIGPVYLLAQEP